MKKNDNSSPLGPGAPSISEICTLLEIANGSTYPEHILLRRLKLLTDDEACVVGSLFHGAMNLLADAEEIIDNRAATANDPWK